MKLWDNFCVLSRSTVVQATDEIRTRSLQRAVGIKRCAMSVQSINVPMLIANLILPLRDYLGKVKGVNGEIVGNVWARSNKI